MNNIIRSQMFVMKHRIVSLTVTFLSALLVMLCGSLLSDDSAEAISQPGFMAMFIFLFM